MIYKTARVRPSVGPRTLRGETEVVNEKITFLVSAHQGFKAYDEVEFGKSEGAVGLSLVEQVVTTRGSRRQDCSCSVVESDCLPLVGEVCELGS